MKRRGEWVIRTPAGVPMRMVANKDAKVITRAFANAHWPAKWEDLAQQGYKPEYLEAKHLKSAVPPGAHP